LALLLPASPSRAAPAEPVPLADFFGNPSVSAAKLSPDGRSLAVLLTGTNGYDRLGVVNLVDYSIHVVAEFSNADVGHVQWVNNNRLLYDSRDKQTAAGDQRYAPGLFAVNRDGSAPRQLAHVSDRTVVSQITIGRELLPWNTFMLDQAGAQDSDWVYVTKVEFGSKDVPERKLIRLNTVTGRTQPVGGPDKAMHWWLDAKGRPALASALEHNLEVLYYLDPKDNKWRKIASFDAYLGGPGAVTPLAFSPEGRLYVVSDRGRDKLALFQYDLEHGQIADQPLVNIEDFDFRGSLVATADKLLGVRYTSDAEGTSWFDADMKATQADIDRQLPNRINSLHVARDSDAPFLLVDSWSDRQPHVFLLYNRATHELSKIGQTRPAIDAERMAALDLVRVKARDGLTIPVWITVPNNSKGTPRPMVVLVHGGPYVRGRTWEWDPESQFLASRGYVVLEPEFRGSTGYGARHFRAGWKQWGLAMQDDIADATRWAIAQGIADPKRICIAGASYGGYATLMGLVRDPELYRCGIDWVGVTDIGLLYTGHWSANSDTSDAYKRYGMPTLIGDPVKDAAQLAATSPLQQAGRISQPLLLAYGGSDQRVPIYHGRKFYDAVKATNPRVEWVVYENEAHGWSLVKTRLDFWSRVEQFLGKHIGAR
ncbi:MAG: alpha/beta hydrolase family protein, partial [Gammaproteobacteria bacterium]